MTKHVLITAVTGFTLMLLAACAPPAAANPPTNQPADLPLAHLQEAAAWYDRYLTLASDDLVGLRQLLSYWTMRLLEALARQMAETLGLHFTGTLGLLLDAKRVELIAEVRPWLNQLNALQFRLAPHAYEVILRLAGEAE
ncbi:MAG: DUF3368 domain-containing protein [Chloroflexota bacterium]